MNWNHTERWLGILITGYVAWVLPYDVRQYLSFVALLNPGLHIFITLFSIAIVCGGLIALLSVAGNGNPLVLGLTVAIPWLLTCIALDFGLDAYYHSWRPSFQTYLENRMWHFVFVPIGSIVFGAVMPFFWKQTARTISPIHNLPRFRK